MDSIVIGGLGAAAAAFIGSWGWLLYKVSGVGKRKRGGKRYQDLDYQRGLLEIEERKNTLEAQRQAIAGSEPATRVYAIAKGRKNQGMGPPMTQEGRLADIALDLLRDGTKRRTAADIRLELMEARAMKRLEREMDDDASDGMTGKERMIFGLVEAVASAAAPALLNHPAFAPHLAKGAEAMRARVEQQQQSTQQQPRLTQDPPAAQPQQEPEARPENVTPFDRARARIEANIVLGNLKGMAPAEFADWVVQQGPGRDLVLLLANTEDKDLMTALGMLEKVPENEHFAAVFRWLRENEPKTRLIVAELRERLGIQQQPQAAPIDITPAGMDEPEEDPEPLAPAAGAEDDEIL